jgi:hypothetical protein
MRLPPLFATFAFSVALASTAMAGPVSLKPVAVSPDLQKKFDKEYGVREVDQLQDAIEASLARALANAGGSVSDSAPVTIETTLIDAKPSHPTFGQLSRQPSLDAIRSISVGGAELRARILDSNGMVLRNVKYRWFETDLAWAHGKSVWGDARTAITSFSAQVARAYRELYAAGS